MSEVAQRLTADDMAGAELSADGRYRYRLWRAWGRGPGVLWIMLNPSTADAQRDDPTIRRCAGFARKWGYKRIEVLNLFALRSPYPGELRLHKDPVGHRNDDVIAQRCEEMRTSLVVAAWGDAPQLYRSMLLPREAVVSRLVGHPLMCIGTTRRGHPRHPLYVPAAKQLERWVPAKEVTF